MLYKHINLNKHFNTLRTCNFLFAYQLTQYNRVCLIESDTIILKNIDDIFELKSPSILVYDKNINKIIENYKCKLDHKQILSECANKSTINGGIILLKPSEKKYNRAIKKIKLVISANCMYPNETLFLLINKHNPITVSISRNNPAIFSPLYALTALIKYKRP